MGIMAAAALVGGSGLLAVETVGMIALAAGVIGAVTENKTLMKISAGLSLGSSIGSLLGTTQAAGATATTAGEVATAGDANALTDAAAAESSTGNSIQDALGAGDEAANVQQAGQTAATVDVTPQAANGVQGPQTAGEGGGLVDEGMQGATGTAVDAGSAAATPGAMTPQVGAETLTPQVIDPISMPAPGETYDVTSRFSDQELLKTGSNPITDSMTETGLRKGESWFGDMVKGTREWWGTLDKSEKLVVGQMGMGLVSGIGKGYMENQAVERQMKFKEDERDYRRRNLTNVPTITYNRPSGLINGSMGA